MNTFARAIFMASAIVASTLPASALELPPAHDCAALAAESVGEHNWFGRISGVYEASPAAETPIVVTGCFPTKRECRGWLREIRAMLITTGYTNCRQVEPDEHVPFTHAICGGQPC